MNRSIVQKQKRDKDWAGIQRAPHLAIVSNRAPYHVTKHGGRLFYQRNVGGLVAALDRILQKTGGSWISWGDNSAVSGRVGVPPKHPAYAMELVDLTKEEVSHYYDGFANEILWPLSHYFLRPQHFRSDYWEAYKRVNEKFAAVLETKGSDIEQVWIHDYHMALLPDLLRKKRPDLSLGFFWHIPFPSSSLFRALPWSHEILHGFLGSDLIGFQTSQDAGNFLSTIGSVLRLPVDLKRRLIDYNGRYVRVGVFPIGVDYRRWQALARSPSTVEGMETVRTHTEADYLLLGVDRLDYSKGICERLLAYEHFLTKYPEYRRRTCFLQIVVPSRTSVEDYKRLKRKIDEIVGRINGRLGTATWIPVRYFYQSVTTEDLAAYYRAADVLMVTSLRDGMNLVAQEYVASRRDHAGTLILSELAGAATILEAAVLVNPYHIEALADAIDVCLRMEPAEKAKRMRRLRRAVEAQDVHTWSKNFLGMLDRTKEPLTPSSKVS